MKKTTPKLSQQKIPTNLRYESIFSKAKEIIYDTLLGDTPISLYWMDSEGILLGCNEKVLKDLELDSLDDYIGKHSNQNSSKEAWQNSLKAIKTGEPVTCEETHVDSTGKKIAYLSIKHPIKDTNGTIIGLMGISIDISKQKNIEEALQEEISKNKRAYRAKLEYIATASHEVKNPTANAIYYNIELKESIQKIQETFLNDIAITLVKYNKEYALREISSMIKNMLQLSSKIEEQQQKANRYLDNLNYLEYLQLEGVKVRYEPENIENLVKNTIMQVEAENNHNIHIISEINNDIPSEILIDRSNIQSVLRIILNNAIRFSKPGDRIKISGYTTRGENDKNHVYVIVQDFGQGMTETQLKYLFTPIQHDEKNSIESRYHKPSLMLSQAKLKIEASGGEISLTSILNSGTKVLLKIPFHHQKSESVDINNTISNDIIPIFMSNKIKVLLVEDDVSMQKIVTDMLVTSNYEVDVAATGHEAFTMAKCHAYQIIIMDIGLPDINGVEAARQIHSFISDTVPIIAHTSHDTEEDEDYFISQGFMFMMPKPLNIETLKKYLDAALEASADKDNE
jgi:two-component system aerobic respiration control sensor histidine kinase ArcB